MCTLVELADSEKNNNTIAQVEPTYCDLGHIYGRRALMSYS